MSTESNIKKEIPDINFPELTGKLRTFAAGRTRKSIKWVIQKLRAPLQKARSKGVTYEELTQWLEQQGVHCSATTLKIYLTRMNRENSGKVTKLKKPQTKFSPEPRPPTSVPRGFRTINDDEL